MFGRQVSSVTRWIVAAEFQFWHWTRKWELDRVLAVLAVLATLLAGVEESRME